MNALGRHVLAECYDADYFKLNNLPLIRQAMLRSATDMGATIISETFHKFSPQGVSGAVVIAESHLSIHTWPELGYAAVDYFTCGNCDPRKGFEALARALGCDSMKICEYARGFVNPLGGGEGAKHVCVRTYKRVGNDVYEEIVEPTAACEGSVA